MENLVALLKNIPKNAKIIAGLVLAVLLIVLVVAMADLNKKDPVDDSLVDVNNFSDTTNVPKDYKAVIENSIDDMIRSNDALADAQFTDAAIREGSYKETDRDGSMSANFIVDIESLHYSFAVKVSWVKGKDSLKDPDVIVTCPHYLDVIYKDKKCIAQPPRTQLERYLPHYGRVKGIKYAVAYQQVVDEAYLRVEMPACGDKTLLDDAVEDTKKWIKSIYLDPNDYKIGVMNTCRE